MIHRPLRRIGENRIGVGGPVVEGGQTAPEPAVANGDGKVAAEA